MTWHYRARKTKDPLTGDTVYGLVEDFGENGYTVNDVVVGPCDTPEELAKWLRIAADDVEKYTPIEDE